MMTWEVRLTGRKNIGITDEQKKTLESYLAMDRDERPEMLTIGHDTIKLSTVLGVHRLKADPIQSKEAQRLRQQELDKFNQECERLAALSIEDRVRTEMNVRIMPPHLRKEFKRHEKEHEFRSKLWNLLEAFFVKNPAMPRCPAKVWFPLLKNYYPDMSKFGKWYEYVARNDNSIIEWTKWNKIRIEYNLQEQLAEIRQKIEKKDDN